MYPTIKPSIRLLTMLAALGVTSAASAEPLKVALIETFSGPASLTGKMIQTAVKFSLARLANDKAWPDGIQLLEYDNQSGPSEAADKLKAAINDGAHIVIQGASSAIAGQITGDVQKHNARNPGREVLFINVGGQAMELTGARCHFYHFRWNTYAEGRMRAMYAAAKKSGALGNKVYIIGQNYSWGHDVQRLTRGYAGQYGYTVVGDVLHDVNKVQDFAPYIAKIKDSGPSSVVTGNWGNDLLLMIKAAADSGMKTPFLTTALDQPGNIAAAGDTAVGHYTVQHFFPDANGAKSEAFAEEYKSKTGQYPYNVQGDTVNGVLALGESLKALKGKPGDKVSVKAIGLAMETVTVESPMGPVTMRSEDHQAMTPTAVAIVSKDAKYKFDNTDKGFKTVKLLSGKDATGPVQDTCKMERPTN